ncbi:hypothetical protein FKM82_011355 [Ascaphus truei]
MLHSIVLFLTALGCGCPTIAMYTLKKNRFLQCCRKQLTTICFLGSESDHPVQGNHFAAKLARNTLQTNTMPLLWQKGSIQLSD